MSDLFATLLDNPIVNTAGSALLFAVVAMWLAAAWWAYRDAARRTESSLAGFLAAGWIVISTPPLLPLALAVYAFARPSTTAAEHRAQSLVAALSFDSVAGASCATCAAVVEPGWRRCPRCATWLAAACAGCGEWAPAGLDLCPFCGREAVGLPVPDELPATAPVAPRAVPAVASPASHLVAASRSQA